MSLVSGNKANKDGVPAIPRKASFRFKGLPFNGGSAFQF